jgi:hypothetical protein
MTEHPSAPLFGVAAEYATERDILAAAALLHAREFGRLAAFAPTPIPGMAELLRVRHRSLRLTGIFAAAAGFAAFFGMCLYATMASYPFIIGDRPVFSWPAFVIPSLSVGTLVGTIAVTLAMLYFNRLPRLNHPAFNIAGFERASGDRYFLTIEARDDRFDPAAVEKFLQDTAPLSIQRVPR